MSAPTQPCGMWPDRTMGCGEPASFGWPSEETGALVPMCEGCRVATGTKRSVLRRLDSDPQPHRHREAIP